MLFVLIPGKVLGAIVVRQIFDRLGFAKKGKKTLRRRRSAACSKGGRKKKHVRKRMRTLEPSDHLESPFRPFPTKKWQNNISSVFNTLGLWSTRIHLHVPYLEGSTEPNS